MRDDCPRLAAGVRLGTDPLTGAGLLLFPEGVLRLNRTGAAILELCSGQSALVGDRGGTGQSSVPNAAAVLEDMSAFVVDLHERGLLRGVTASRKALQPLPGRRLITTMGLAGCGRWGCWPS